MIRIADEFHNSPSWGPRCLFKETSMPRKTMARKITTPAERIDQLLASYEELDREAHDVIDLHVAELVIEHPGIPFAIIKQCEYTNKAGSSLNVPEALRLLRKKFEPV
jgi:hypothetical protein